MLTIIFGILLWNIIVSLLGKADKSRAFCGMVGFCGSEPANPLILRLMLMYNNSRGGDATGWVIDDEITKDTEPVEKFLQKYQIKTSSDQSNYTIIAHARKASMGMLKNSKAHAHPFGIFKDGTEKEKYDLVLAMNGTLSNEETFAEHFGFDWKRQSNTDTQMLATVMAKLGIKEFKQALEKYAGTATLLFYTPAHRNTLCVFKDPDRPMYCWQPSPGQCWLSSMKEAFISVGAEEKDIIDMTANHLYKIVKGEIKLKQKIERSPLFKAAVDNYERMYPHNTAATRSTYTPNSRNSGVSINTVFNKDNIVLDKGVDTLCFGYDKYFRNFHPVNGRYYVNKEGNIIKDKRHASYSVDHKECFFIAGYKIKDEASFEKLKARCFDGDNIDWAKYGEIKTSELLEYVDYPLQATSSKGPYWIVPKSIQDNIKDTESKVECQPFLSEYVITYKPNKEQIRGTNIFCLEAVSARRVEKEEKPNVVSNSLRDDLLKIHGEKKLEIFISVKLREKADVKIEDVYDQARMFLFRMAGNHELQEFFYKDIFLPYAQSRDIITVDEADKIVDEARHNVMKWNSRSIMIELEKVAKNLAADLTNAELDNTEKGPIMVSNIDGVVDVSDLGPRERLKLYRLQPGTVSPSTALSELENSNRIVSGNAFREDVVMCKYKEWNDLVTKYAGSVEIDSREMFEFTSAVGIVMKENNVITLETLIDIYKMDNKKAASTVAEAYENYVARFGEVNEELTEEEEEGGDITMDSFAIDDVEMEMVAQYDAVVDSLKILNKGFEEVDEAYSTPKIKDMKRHINGVFTLLAKLDPSIKEKNEVNE